MQPSTTRVEDLPPARRRQVEALAAQVETPHLRTVYGQQREVRPTFCRGVIGDGAHLLVVTALRTAPAYHAVLVDSSWISPASSPLIRSGLEADIDADRKDILVDALIEFCGDGDLWHEDNGEEAVTPPGLFCADMGFTHGVEPLGSDGLLAER